MSNSKKSLFRWAPAALFGVAVVVFLILFIRYQRKPEILEIDRLVAGPGDRIEIVGRYFGDGLDGSKLQVGSGTLTSAGIIEWTDNRIVARVPRNDGAVLVKVKTGSGMSNGVILADESRFPSVDYGPWLPGAPFIEYAEPPAGSAGTLVTLHGKGFGDKRGGGQIWVNHTDASALLGTEEPDLARYIEAEFINLWSDETVSFWIPQGASSGNIYLKKGGAFSNPVSMDIRSAAGTVQAGTDIQWSLRQELSVDRIGAFPGNSLYVYLPAPQSGPGQKNSAVMEPVDSSGYVKMRNEGHLSLYRLDELAPGERRLISRQIVVTTYPVRYRVSPGELVPYDPRHPEIAASLGGDDRINPDLVAGSAARVAGGARDDWTKSRAVYDAVMNWLDWQEDLSFESIEDVLAASAADSAGYAYLFCSLARAVDVPARPVGGIVVTSDRKTQEWWWAEIWIQGLGWVPVDPAAGDGAGNFSTDFRDEDSGDAYFGGLDGRHIAFSRGRAESSPLQPHPELRIPDDFYSLQDVWEEVSGNLESYVSRWNVPRVTAVYPSD
ncbi:MAG: transglutaminase domain-containing protein [Spirochaetaceae bacterium]|nr:transglutaminase domain-containing protein [Spirochaetaceae bacterium]MDT8296653.1 transglutaminase domain-containing protein [Spirochaetaceae bacterium]